MKSFVNYGDSYASNWRRKGKVHEQLRWSPFWISGGRVFVLVLVGLWVSLVVAVLGAGFLWVCLGVAWEVLCSCGFWVPWVFSCLFVFFVLFSSFRHYLVYFLCTRVAPPCVFDICNITYQKNEPNVSN